VAAKPKPRVIVVLSEEGRISERRIVESKDAARIAKDIAARALELWDPTSSDFTIIRSELELRYKLPIDPDLYDIIEELKLPKEVESGELIIKVPVYTISFDNTWLTDAYHDRRMYVVALVFDPEGEKQVEDYAREATKAPKQLQTEATLRIDEEALKRLEEGLEEATGSRKRRKSRRS
jgi:hypothetical protein